jgi:hypothetical protein
MLDRSEYIEQAYLFQLLRERTSENVPLQEAMEQVHHELLATTSLPMAVSFLLTELKHQGMMSGGMQRLSHYFHPFQTYLVDEAEREAGRFAMHTALSILEADARYRIDPTSRPGFFFFQLEVLSRNRLNYDRGLLAISKDPIYDDQWSSWILKIRAELGLVDLAETLFLVSEEYKARLVAAGQSTEHKGPFLFGTKEGRIALANRRKDPLYLFGAMQRHLGYPKVPRLKPSDPNVELVPQLARRIERLEFRLQLLEQEQKSTGIDITKFYQQGPKVWLPEDDEST